MQLDILQKHAHDWQEKVRKSLNSLHEKAQSKISAMKDRAQYKIDQLSGRDKVTNDYNAKSKLANAEETDAADAEEAEEPKTLREQVSDFWNKHSDILSHRTDRINNRRNQSAQLTQEAAKLKEGDPKKAKLNARAKELLSQAEILEKGALTPEHRENINEGLNTLATGLSGLNM